MEVLISIIVPTKNSAKWIENLLQSLTQQSLFSQSEIIIIDSGSQDGSIELIKKFPVKLIQISPSEFNHGETRNLGCKYANGKYIVYTVQDAVPSDKFWLQTLLDGFKNDDGSFAGVCGKQISPHVPTANPIFWDRPISQPSIRKFQYKAEDEFNTLTPLQKKNVCSWDNVNAIYKKEILQKHPFKKILFGEDMYWAYDVLQLGYSLVYNEFAVVYHYHVDSPEYSFKRTFVEAYFKYKLFGLKLSKHSLLYQSIRDIKLLYISKGISFFKKIKWLFYNYKTRIAENKAVHFFEKKLSEGENVLDNYFEETFKESPMAKSIM